MSGLATGPAATDLTAGPAAARAGPADPGAWEVLPGLLGPGESPGRRLAAMVAASLGATRADVLT